MKITLDEKLKMCKEHVEGGKTLSHVCEIHNYKDISKLKYWINLYKKHGENIFKNRDNIYRRDTKLLAISRVKNGESIRSVSVDFGLTEPGILSDWLAKYNNEGEQSIQDTYPRKNYLDEDERYKKHIDKKLKEEMWYNNEYKYETSKDLIKEIHNYIKYYNETRIVTKLKTSPINNRNQVLNNNLARVR